jgi:DNA-binding response OmpR family regulator
MEKKSRKKILIIDDDPDIIDSLSLILDLNGYKAAGITRLKSIHEELEKHTPDIVILDVLLSGKDGRDICKKLKSTKKAKDIPVIMISAHPDAAESTRQAGADHFVAKPFEISELISKVDSLLPS